MAVAAGVKEYTLALRSACLRLSSWKGRSWFAQHALAPVPLYDPVCESRGIARRTRLPICFFAQTVPWRKRAQTNAKSGSPIYCQREKGNRVGKGRSAGTDSAGVSRSPQGRSELPGHSEIP